MACRWWTQRRLLSPQRWDGTLDGCDRGGTGRRCGRRGGEVADGGTQFLRRRPSRLLMSSEALVSRFDSVEGLRQSSGSIGRRGPTGSTGDAKPATAPS